MTESRLGRIAALMTVVAMFAGFVLSTTGAASASSSHHPKTKPHHKAKSHNKAKAAAAISVSAAGKQYLDIVTPVNATLSAFGTQPQNWSSSTTNSQALADAGPSITALENLETELLADKWPAGDETDIKTLVSDIGPLRGDLQGLGSINLLSISSWESTFERDASTLSSAVGIVRHDLGLPPAAGHG